MAAKKGSKKTGGRTKGTPNKLTASTKESIQEAFDYIQGIKGVCLNDWAKENATDFYKHIWVKLLPLDLNHSGEVSGKFEVILRSTPIPLSNSEDDVDKE